MNTIRMSAPLDHVDGTQSGSTSTGHKRKGTPNKRWTAMEDSVLIPCLVDMVKAGLKVDKSFKRQAFVEAAKVVNNRFPMANVTADKVENRLRSLKMKYQEIKKVMDLSGVGWNDSQKMLVLEDETYRTFVEGHPKAKDYLNKPIPMFDELRMICGDDHATGEFARSIFHPFGAPDPESETQPEGLDNMESDPLDDYEQQEQPRSEQPRSEQQRSSTSNRNSRPPRASRTNTEDVIMNDIAQGIGEMAGSLKALKKKNWKEKLADALDTLQGYSIQDMNLLFVTLRDDRRLAEDFFLRTQSLREYFVDEFLAERRASGP